MEKRIKNVVPLNERCMALRANSEQCTRRKKNGHEYCGTHIKGKPHGILNEKPKNNEYNKVSVWQEEIQGIIYYIDNNNNVYNAQDIVEDKISPPVIAKWLRNQNGDITIPSLFEKKN